MIEQFKVAKMINVPSEKVWLAISNIGNLDSWISVIKHCSVEGEGVGAIRTLELEDGSEMKDRIDEINHKTRIFRYVRTQSPFPISNYTATVSVDNADNENAIVSWKVKFDVSPEARDEMVDLIKSVLSDCISGIEKDLK